MVIVALTTFMIVSHTFLYYDQIKKAEAFHDASLNAVGSVFKLAVNDYLVTGDNYSLQSLVETSIDEGLIVGISVYEKNDTPSYSYPSDFSTEMPSKRLHIGDTGDSAYFQIFIDATKITSAKKQLANSVAAFTFFVIIGIVLAVAFLNSNFVKPILALSAQAKKIATGNYSFVPQNAKSDEIGMLSKSLEDISAALHERDIQQQKHLNEIVRVNAELVIDRTERANYLETLINDSTPHLTEALVALQSIADRPIQHAMLNQSLLIVLTQFEQARSMLDETKTALKCDFEKMTVAEYSRLLREYAGYFCSNKNAVIDYRFKHEAELDAEKTLVLVDKKLVIKILSLLFDVLPSNTDLVNPEKISVVLVVDNIKEELSRLEVMIKSDTSSLPVDACNVINEYFSRQESANANREDSIFPKNINKIAIRYLKYLTMSVRGQYHVSCVSGKFESRFYSSLLSCPAEESVGSRLSRHRNGLRESKLTLVGTGTYLRDINPYLQPVSIVSYESFVSENNPDLNSHYVIDMISDPKAAKIAADFFRDFDLKEKNLALLIPSLGSDKLLDYCYELGADLIIYDSMNEESITKILAPKHRVTAEETITEFLKSLTSDRIQ